MPLRGQIAAAPPGCGLSRPRDEQEGRFRTASLHPPAAPNDHHHPDLANVLPASGVATMCHPWPIVALGNVLLPRPLQPAGRMLFTAMRLTIKGWTNNRPHVVLGRAVDDQGV